MPDTSWIFRFEPRQTARLRLFCFPHAGAGASLFQNWPRYLMPSVDVLAVQLPGRENRIREAPISNMNDLVEALIVGLAPHFSGPFAFFGHSLGALVAFELARRLDAETVQGQGLVHLIVSGQRAPTLPDPFPHISHLTDGDFLTEVVRRYDAIPKLLLEDAEMVRLLLPRLRADFLLAEGYSFQVPEALRCRISCLGGAEDWEATPDELVDWRHRTTGSFEAKVFPGGHFFLTQEPTRVMAELNRLLLSTIRSLI